MYWLTRSVMTCHAEITTMTVMNAVSSTNQTEMPSAYAAADILVLPSDRRETWGMVVNEAMASGLPAVVAEAVGCVPDLVRCGVTGFSYAARDIGALADGVRALVAEPLVRARMGAAAAAHVAGFSPEAAAAGILAAAAA